MSTPENQVPVNTSAVGQLPTDVSSLHSLVHNIVAKLMAHSQTVQELIKANMELRAALHLLEADKSQLQACIQNLLTPATPASVEAAPTADPQNADPVSA